MPISLLALAVALLAGLAVWRLGGAWWKYRGQRIITCPETRRPAGVVVDATHAAASAFGKAPQLRLSECTRWPEKAGCGQECLSQIEKGPGECLVRTLVARWYEGKTCVSCGKPIQDVAWADQRPGLRAPDGTLVAWPDVAPETLPELFRTHAPVCWNCLVVGKVALERPDEVTVRPPREQLYS